MGQAFTEQNDVTGIKGGDVIADKADAAARGEESQLHGRVVVPVKALSALGLGTSIAEEDLNVQERAAPADDAERLSSGSFDPFALSAHPPFLHEDVPVATRSERLGLKLIR